MNRYIAIVFVKLTINKIVTVIKKQLKINSRDCFSSSPPTVDLTGQVPRAQADCWAGLCSPGARSLQTSRCPVPGCEDVMRLWIRRKPTSLQFSWGIAVMRNVT